MATTCASDTLGRRISQTTGGVTTTFGWDDASRLETWSRGGESATYTYDAAGQRTSATVTAGGTTTTTDYTYDGITLLRLAAARSDETTYAVAYLTGENRRPYAGVYTAGAASPVTFLIATTDRGDVVALTDTAGAPFARYTYDPYGAVLSQDSNAVTGIMSDVAAAIADRQPLRYAGYAYDAHSATYYLSARHYDPATMRFLTKDSARDDGEESAYQYCAGDPVGRVDPTGEVAIALPALGIMVVGTVVAAYLMTPQGQRDLLVIIGAFGKGIATAWVRATLYTKKQIIVLAKGGKSGLNDKARQALDQATSEAAKSGKNRSVDAIKKRAGEIAEKAYKSAKNSAEKAKWKEAQKQLGNRRKGS
ncbi:MAG: RHS repeat-associated core domain-containing protein [Coriobacteriia bacterium]|nr:RHS repeat-associated core domain-containing protein [Coriobacteriia bacterium]